MTPNHSNNNRNSSNEIHKNERLNHITLPSIHPDPLKSIELQKNIYDLVRSKENIFNLFQDIFNSLDIQEQYFFLNYGLEYLYPLPYYPNYLLTYFEEQSQLAEDNATLLKETSSLTVTFNNSSLYDHLKEEVDKTKQCELIIEFISEQLPLLDYKLKLYYRDILQGQDYTFTPEHFAIDNYKLEPKIYQITIPQKTNEFLDAVREVLSPKISIEQIDAFLYNSFYFASNYTPMEVLELDFGNSETIENHISFCSGHINNGV